MSDNSEVNPNISESFTFWLTDNEFANREFNPTWFLVTFRLRNID